MSVLDDVAQMLDDRFDPICKCEPDQICETCRFSDALYDKVSELEAERSAWEATARHVGYRLEDRESELTDHGYSAEEAQEYVDAIFGEMKEAQEAQR
jgi:hypothetical protein